MVAVFDWILKRYMRSRPETFPACTNPDGCRCVLEVGDRWGRWVAVNDAKTCPTCTAWHRWTTVKAS